MRTEFVGSGFRLSQQVGVTAMDCSVSSHSSPLDCSSQRLFLVDSCSGQFLLHQIFQLCLWSSLLPLPNFNLLNCASGLHQISRWSRLRDGFDWSFLWTDASLLPPTSFLWTDASLLPPTSFLWTDASLLPPTSFSHFSRYAKDPLSPTPPWKNLEKDNEIMFPGFLSSILCLRKASVAYDKSPTYVGRKGKANMASFHL